jgi:hypothetical protein
MGKHPPSTQKQPAKSYVEASLDHNDRYPGVAMAKDGVPRRAWRKGSQWFAMTREHATIVAEDVEVFEAFEKHCNVTARRAAAGGGGGGGDDDAIPRPSSFTFSSCSISSPFSFSFFVAEYQGASHAAASAVSRTVTFCVDVASGWSSSCSGSVC